MPTLPFGLGFSHRLNSLGCRGLMATLVISLLAACGGAEPSGSAQHADTHGHEFVDFDGVHELTADEIVSASVQDILADRLRAQREAANFSASLNLASYEVNYDAQPAISRPGYFEVTVKSQPYPLVTAQISGQTQSYPIYGATFGFADIKLTKVDGQVQLINNTLRTFRQMLVRRANGAMLALDFGTQTILPFSTSLIQAQGLTGDETFYETAGLFRPVGYRFNSALMTAEACGTTPVCYRLATPAEQRIFESLLNRVRAIYNTHGMMGYTSFFAADAAGCIRFAECVNGGEDTQLYMWTQVGKMALHPRGAANLCILNNSGGTAGRGTVGGNSGNLCAATWGLRISTIHHESAHNYGYSHASGITYGLSNSLGVVGTQDMEIEVLPSRALVATPTTEANTWVLSVLGTRAQTPQAMRFMFLAREQGFSARLGTIAGNSNQFVLKLDKKPAAAFSISVYDQAPNTRGELQPEPLGSVVLQAL